ncbi:fluoride efflux transporter FluC [Natrialbaceae archaeon AArc-T1-2]|uniref:fluoride efflux transporter FluC n=1 Tax=Natrialbaceae archaeon AArc-T1-2 TaxID=3053904 RepID=UPI00255A87FE|nr:CrcB family protein [Natrialbaceae archaeon AArc-T1-2]WIV68622.1 CrcB family protein [Natrialbaceae archaeon AArc-T1-2]
MIDATLFAMGLALEPEPTHLVGAGAAFGALARHWVYLYVSWEDVPAATFTVNVLGSFLFGALLFAGVDDATLRLAGIGFCGSFTTFSSFSVETVQIWERGDRKLAVAVAAANLLVAVAAIGLAWVVIAVAV